MAEGVLLFGGTFDPVHNGHLIIARATAERLHLRRVMLIPAGTPPHKPPAHAPAADRLAMVKLAVEGDPTFEVSDMETHRTGPSYTLDTLRDLRGRLCDVELCWLIGQDSLADLPSWHRADEVLELASIVIAARPGRAADVEQAIAALAGRLPDRHLARLRQGVLQTPLVDISSTDIRRRIAAGLPIHYLVPDAVAHYIADHGLYAAPDPPPPGQPPCRGLS